MGQKNMQSRKLERSDMLQISDRNLRDHRQFPIEKITHAQNFKLCLPEREKLLAVLSLKFSNLMEYFAVLKNNFPITRFWNSQKFIEVYIYYLYF